MRNLLPFLAAGVAALTAASVAQAQTADTATAASPRAVIVAQQPAPIETVETVHTVSTTPPARHVVSRPARSAPLAKTTDRVTTTQSYAQADIAAAPPPVVAPPPPFGPRYYNMVPPAPLPPPPGAVPADVGVIAPVPTYRYVYEPGRILVIDPYTNIAVQALPR